jgi:hypothetical protein
MAMKSSEKEAPVFRNRTKIDQVVYDESYTAINVPSGKTIKGDWFKRYATGKRNSTFVLVDSKEEKKEEPGDDKKEVVKDDKNKRAADNESKK